MCKFKTMFKKKEKITSLPDILFRFGFYEKFDSVIVESIKLDGYPDFDLQNAQWRF